VPEVTAEPGQQVTELFQAHQLELVRLDVLMVGDLAAAEDVVQDAFEQLHRRWRTLRKPSNARFTPLPGFQVGREVFWAAW
jgi:DNA-directed RNA polymerase specialized sigma24 family protein